MDYRTIIIGESSHGIHEFAIERLDIALEMCEKDLIKFIAVEWDWCDCFKFNQFIRGVGGLDVETSRWPHFMWSNKETKDFLIKLRMVNDGRRNKIGFYGIDAFGLANAVKEVDKFILKNSVDISFDMNRSDRRSSAILDSCTKFEDNEQTPSSSCKGFLSKNYENIEKNVIKLLDKVQRMNLKDGEELFNFKICCKIVITICKMSNGRDDKWKLREDHMFDVYKLLEMRFRGMNKLSRGLILAHNTHVQLDTCITQRLPTISGMLDLDALRIGIICYSGESLTAKEWGDKVMVTRIKSPVKGSWEDDLFNKVKGEKFYIELKSERSMKEVKKFRAIGAVHVTDQYFDMDLNCSFHFVIGIRNVTPIEMI